MGSRTILALLLAVLCTPPSWAAVTVDTTASGEGFGVDTSSTSHSHTIASDANLLIVCLAERDTNVSGYTTSTATVTVGGVAMTQLIGVTDTLPSTRTVMFYKISPTTGAQTIAATADTGSDRLVTVSISLKSAATTSTFNTAGSVGSSAPGTDADLNSLASAVGELGLLCGTSSINTSTSSPDPTVPVSTLQIDVVHTNATGLHNWIYTEAGAAPTIDMRVDLAASVRWSVVGVSVRPLTAAPSVFNPRRRF